MPQLRIEYNIPEGQTVREASAAVKELLEKEKKDHPLGKFSKDPEWQTPHGNLLVAILPFKNNAQIATPVVVAEEPEEKSRKKKKKNRWKKQKKQKKPL